MKKPIQRTTGVATENPLVENPDHEAIRALASEFWLGRGCPIGSPEVDWFRAEEEMKNMTVSVAAAAA